MKFSIKNRFSGALIFESESASISITVKAAIEGGADLSYADLSSANLSYADLRSANLSYADLSSANLSYADLSSADLSYADLSSANLSYADLSYADLISANLSYADLSYADLSYADLSYANLSYADLSSANLSYADLSYADLSYANLSSANLSYANLPAPTILLLSVWGSVSAELCADLMFFDAENHPEPSAFDKWAAGGNCPYGGNIRVHRAANFEQKREHWGKGKYCRPYDLMLRLFAEKEIKF